MKVIIVNPISVELAADQQFYILKNKDTKGDKRLNI